MIKSVKGRFQDTEYLFLILFLSVRVMSPQIFSPASREKRTKITNRATNSNRPTQSKPQLGTPPQRHASFPLSSSACSTIMSNPNSPANPDKINQLIDASKPILKKFTFSSFMGYCGGLTAKKVSKAMAIVIGAVFFGLQGLAYKGLIEIDWKKVQQEAVGKIDTVSSGK